LAAIHPSNVAAFKTTSKSAKDAAMILAIRPDLLPMT
jgi:hypothetical protein